VDGPAELEPAAELEQLEDGAELDQGGDPPGELEREHGAELEQLTGEALAELEHDERAPELEQRAPIAAPVPVVRAPAAAPAPTPAAPVRGGLFARVAAERAEERRQAEFAELERQRREQTNSAPVRRGSVWAREPSPLQRGIVMQSARTGQLSQSRGKGHSIERAYAELWALDKIDKNRWAQFFCAASTGAQTVEQIELASHLADQMYIELMKREQGDMG
jgi:hypothetical protein